MKTASSSARLLPAALVGAALLAHAPTSAAEETADAVETVDVRLITVASEKSPDDFSSDSGLFGSLGAWAADVFLGDDTRTSAMNFSTQSAPSDAAGLVFQTVSLERASLTGITFDVNRDQSGKSDTTMLSGVEAGAPQDLIRDDGLHVSNPSGASEAFMVDVYAQVPADSASLANQDWMAASQKDIRGLTLGQIALPGAHDAGSYGINTRSPSSPDGTDTTEALAALDTEQVAVWGRAQGASVAQQLRAGVRYFDLRVGEFEDGSLWLMHSLFSEPLDAVLADVEHFLALFPDEIVVLDFQNIKDKNNNAIDATSLAGLVTALDGLPLIPPSLGGNEGAEIRINDILNADGRVVVVMQDGDVSNDADFFTAHSDYWSRATYMSSAWHDTHSTCDLMSALDDEVYGARPDRKKLWVLQAQRAFPSDVADAALVAVTETNLEFWAADDAASILKRLAGDNYWAKEPLNIVMVDWAATNGVPDAVIAHNQGRCASGRYYGGQCLAGLSASYEYTQAEAEAACTTQFGSDAALATLADITAAQEQGYNRCVWSWVADEADDSQGYRVLPMRIAADGCLSRAGVNEETVDKSSKQSGICALPAVFE